MAHVQRRGAQACDRLTPFANNCNDSGNGSQASWVIMMLIDTNEADSHRSMALELWRPGCRACFCCIGFEVCAQYENGIWSNKIRVHLLKGLVKAGEVKYFWPRVQA